MKIGIVGYQGLGKSTLFHWLSGVEPDPKLAHASQSAMVVVPEDRVGPLCEVYKPKKITLASLNIVDTPGLSRTHEGSAGKLALIREASCLLVVVAAYDKCDPAADLQSFEEDLLIADLEIVSGRIARLRESVKKPRPNRDEELAELHALEPLHEQLEAGHTLHGVDLTPEQQKATKSFQLFSEKSRFVVMNVAEDEENPDRFLESLPNGIEGVAVSLSLQLELTQMSDDDRREFCEEMGVRIYSTDDLIRKIMDVSGQMLFFTAGEKEVRTWMIHKGGTAVEAAGNIHSDLARGFIRAETMSCDDLIRLGSEREIKANNLMRHEPKDYVIADGDILNIRFSV